MRPRPARTTGNQSVQLSAISELDKTMGRNVRKARLASQLTRAECAEAINVPILEFCNCEVGRHRLTQRQFSELGKLLSIDVTELLSSSHSGVPTCR
jgi:ribosome-binding protein aMBF1 (putative translation factor)